MKLNLFLALLVFGAFSLSAQDNNTIPDTKLKSLSGKAIQSGEFSNDGQAYVVSFWATWCKPCIQELTAFNENYIDWQEETGMKVIAISIDDARNAKKVLPFVNGQAWEFEVYLDENQDFKRAMNVNTVPHTFIVNGKNEIVYSHNSYAPGDEEELIEKIRKVNAGKPLN